jgi:Thioredoxin
MPLKISLHLPPLMQQLITQAVIDKGMTFAQYMDLTKSLIESPHPEGIYAGEATMRYTKSNWKRMNMVLENTVISQRLYNQLSELKDEWIWLVISEPWCGDASWGVPALYLVSTSSDKIDFRIILRDENSEIMQAYQTDGTDSIPKLICLRKSDLKELGTWGPRPAALHEMVLKWKNQPGIDYRESVRQLHAWYQSDMGKSIMEELSLLVKDWKE